MVDYAPYVTWHQILYYSRLDADPIRLSLRLYTRTSIHVATPFSFRQFYLVFIAVEYYRFIDPSSYYRESTLIKIGNVLYLFSNRVVMAKDGTGRKSWITPKMWIPLVRAVRMGTFLSRFSPIRFSNSFHFGENGRLSPSLTSHDVTCWYIYLNRL